MKKQIILYVLIVFLPSLVIAQPYIEWIGNGWGLGIDDANPVIADIDSDGLLDLLVGTYNGDIRHFEQTAVDAYSFSLLNSHFNNINVGLFAAPELTDIDNDNRLDLIVGEWKGHLYHYEQSTTNADSFLFITDNFSGINVESNSSPFFTDLDQDGLLDLLIGAHSGNLFLYEQESANSDNFLLITDSLNVDPPTMRINPAVTDLDQDGLLDLIIGGNSGNFSHYEQDVSGSLDFVLHARYLFEDNPIYGGSVPCLADLDNDGLLDMIAGEMDGLYFHFEQDSMYSSEFNIQSDNFLNLMDVGSGAAPCLTDLDDDGLLDIIVGEWHGNINHFEQIAAGSLDFMLVSDTLGNFDVGDYSLPAITDLDADGLIDLIVGERDGTLNHFEQDATNPNDFNLLTENFNGIDLINYSAPFFTDLDGDNLIDMILGESEGKLYLYEQQAANSDLFDLVFDSLNVYSLDYQPTPYVMDYDDDGLLELFVGGSNGRIYHYEQNAVNSTDFVLLTNNFENISVGNKSRIAFGDINDDGFEDLIIGEANGGLCLYLNQLDTDIRSPQSVDQKPVLFQLYANYPNPFNPSTTIQFYLHKSTNIKLKIFNIAGQEVATLINGFKSAGDHRITWDPKGLSSGLYFYRLQAGEYSATRKLLLQK
ncbi:T9SS type A sorting domain-containing protein [candidate division KSB1 bacterium]|nr:T9SS type A sorting domain-containing protein [candidate division KSB1 bacterium]